MGEPMSHIARGLRAVRRLSAGFLVVVASLAFARPSYANTRYVSLDQQLIVEFDGECSTATPSGSYRLQNGVSGTITANNCSNLGGDQFVGRFADTAGTYRCYGTMSQEWGRVILTTWEIEGAVSGYSCLDVGERYNIEMNSGQTLNAQVVAQDVGNNAIPSLRAGAYYRGGGYVSIYEHNGQFCYSGFSRNGTLVASISEDPTRSGTYLFDTPIDNNPRIFQVNDTTLSYGGGEYEIINDTLPFSQLGLEMQTCLTSEEPYYEFEERTDRGRPSQNR